MCAWRIRKQFQRRTICCTISNFYPNQTALEAGGGGHSREVAFALLTHQPRVQISMLLNFFSQIFKRSILWAHRRCFVKLTAHNRTTKCPQSCSRLKSSEQLLKKSPGKAFLMRYWLFAKFREDRLSFSERFFYLFLPRNVANILSIKNFRSTEIRKSRHDDNSHQDSWSLEYSPIDKYLSAPPVTNLKKLTYLI